MKDLMKNLSWKSFSLTIIGSVEDFGHLIASGATYFCELCQSECFFLSTGRIFSFVRMNSLMVSSMSLLVLVSLSQRISHCLCECGN